MFTFFFFKTCLSTAALPAFQMIQVLFFFLKKEEEEGGRCSKNDNGYPGGSLYPFLSFWGFLLHCALCSLLWQVESVHVKAAAAAEGFQLCLYVSVSSLFLYLRRNRSRNIEEIQFTVENEKSISRQ